MTRIRSTNRGLSTSTARDCVHLLSALRRASGNLLEVDRTDFGRRALFYDGIPIVVDDNQPDNEVEGSSGAVCSSIYPIRFGQAEGVMGLEHGGIDIEEIGELETKDATRHRIKWYWTEFVD